MQSSLCTLYPGAVPWMRTYMKAATSALQERLRPPKPVRESPPFLSTDAANANTQKHLQSFAKTMRTIFRIVGSFEATFMAVRGCFYGVLYGLEYGAQGLHVLSEFPAIRIAFNIFEHFWNYVKLLGRKGPFIGFLALICTYIGRSLIPILRDLLPAVCKSSWELSFFLAKSGDLSCTLRLENKLWSACFLTPFIVEVIGFQRESWGYCLLSGT